MSNNTIVDPRLKSLAFKYLFLGIDSNGNPLYLNPDETLQKILNILSTLLKDVNSFSTETDTFKLDKYALAIHDNFTSLANIVKPCAISKDRTKCSQSICKYVDEVQQVNIAYINTLGLITAPANKKKYQFIFFYAQYYLNNIITTNPNNQSSDRNYYLCGSATYQPRSEDPMMKAQYDALMVNASTELETVRDSVATYNLLIVAGVLFAIVIVICIIKFTFFNK
jgi:hypothetical protein